MAAERRKCLKSLELQEGATEEEIRKAYKRLALKYHPDKNDSDDAKGKFQEIGYAYKYLTEGARAFSPSDPFDMREEFVVRLFEEMFFSQFRGFGGFPFFYDESDEDDFYFDTDSDRECFCGYCHTTGARDAGKRTYPNKYPGPHTTGHAYRQPSKKHQKKMEKRQRHKERRKEKENQARNERQRATRNSYTDDINPEMKKETRDKSAPKPAEKKPEENRGSRPDTPTQNHQQQQQPTTKKQKKKEMSEQHKREREMEEIAAELTRKLEQEKKKQQEKQKQEAQKKQEEKENNINFNYMFENGKKSKRARQRERKREGTTSQTSSTYSGTTSAPRPPFSNINKSSDTANGKPGKSGSTFDGRPRSGSRFDVLDDDFYDSDRGSSSVSSGSSVEAGSLRSRPEAGSLHSRPEAGSLHSRPEAGSLHSRPKLSVYYADNNKQPAGRDVLSSNSANLTASQSHGQTAQRYPRQQNDKSQGTNVNNFNYTNNRGFNSNTGDQWKIKKENQYETETGDQFGAKRNSPSFPSNFRTDQQNKSNIQFGFNVGLKSEPSDQIGAKTRVPSGVTSSFRIENRPKVDIQFGYVDFVSSAQGPSNLKNTTATEIKSNAVNGEKVLANKGAQDMNKSNEAMKSTAAKSDPLDGEKVNKAAHDITKTNGAVKSTAAENVALGVVDFETEEGHQFVKDWSVYDSDDGDDADDDDDEKDQLNFGYGASRNPQQRNSLENGDNSRGYPQQRGREFIPRTRGNKVPKESVYGRPPVFDTGMRGPRYPPARGEMYPPPPPVHAYPPHRGEYPGQPPFRGEYPGQPPFRGEYSRPPPFRGEYSGPPPFKGEYPGQPPFRGEYPGPPPFMGDYPGPPPFNGEYHRPPPFRGDYSRPPPFRGEYHHTPFRGDYHGAPPSRGGNREPVGFNRGGYPVPKYESNTGKPENSVPNSLSHSDNKNISDNKKIPDAKTNQTTASSTSAMVNSGLNKPSDKPDKPSVSQNCGKAPSVISGNWSDTKANNAGPMKQNMFSDRASSGGSLDSLDDIDLCDNQSASTYSYELEDLGTAGKRSPSYIDIGLDEFLSRDNLGVPSAMFSDSIKNYYK